ncbi:hypothetical protein A3B45_01375 [Candidatus Daviesbacteria bacterium RIFCSPLOWO2_01_FULL_39_12]|uniref:Putative pre-16S rRNA nuclease n=1 Tax=Candidatus Daviesbacteria bacterium RIFCSPLOWO2_01_FULL_39_12 TaxID=1797785 RepID=A0A1F5KQQ5_9BACT|nr:MAG: hypothetical protein A3D79_02645 [Candidatus Daviesbacteria bacterium RIFCSPHIGHO2_02_FULL_39_8]OGE43169.1 MAG: hypothetical protein A3B45_01375 [Candidatus Daviesbacteria bacterium RIFCSPLOWO2_01_FULL_39_12]
MKYLGIDFGLKRVGLAISEGSLASAWKVVEVQSLKDASEKIEKIIRDGDFDKVVVGLPEGKIGQTVVGFINTLRKKGFEVVGVDETLSSYQAIQKMIELNIPKQKRKISDDMAAAIILQNWLDQR